MNAIPDIDLTDTASLDWFTSILKAEGLLDDSADDETNIENPKEQFLSFDSIWRSSRKLG